jgi:hypothetical protein
MEGENKNKNAMREEREGPEVQTIKIQRFILRNHEIHLPDSSDLFISLCFIINSRLV